MPLSFCSLNTSLARAHTTPTPSAAASSPRYLAERILLALSVVDFFIFPLGIFIWRSLILFRNVVNKFPVQCIHLVGTQCDAYYLTWQESPTTSIAIPNERRKDTAVAAAAAYSTQNGVFKNPNPNIRRP